jgi:predicted amidohydrolase
VSGVCDWARLHRVTIVSAFLDDSRPSNELIIAAANGEVEARYEKQHTAPEIEAKPRERMPPGRARVSGPEKIAVSAVICVDLDYGDLVKPVARAGGILAVPSNDWPDIEEIHHRTAVWSVVLSGVSLIRSTGHGTSAAFDATGRVISHKSSRYGPVVLVADLPV